MISGVQGSVSQVREVTAELMQLAKTNNIAIFIVWACDQGRNLGWSAYARAYGGYGAFILKESATIPFVS